MVRRPRLLQWQNNTHWKITLHALVKINQSQKINESVFFPQIIRVTMFKKVIHGRYRVKKVIIRTSSYFQNLLSLSPICFHIFVFFVFVLLFASVPFALFLLFYPVWGSLDLMYRIFLLIWLQNYITSWILGGGHKIDILRTSIYITFVYLFILLMFLQPFLCYLQKQKLTPLCKNLNESLRRRLVPHYQFAAKNILY